MQKVSFTRMTDGTKEDFDLISSLVEEAKKDIAIRARVVKNSNSWRSGFGNCEVALGDGNCS